MSRFTRFFDLRGSWRDVRVAWRLVRDPRVPPVIKLVPLAFVLYALWPLDLITDAWPVIGQLDDVGVFLLGLRLFLHLAPRDLVAAHRIGTGP
jgi:uncharacterized membrane protein YkvA (DUF1232 family)